MKKNTQPSPLWRLIWSFLFLPMGEPMKASAKAPFPWVRITHYRTRPRWQSPNQVVARSARQVVRTTCLCFMSNVELGNQVFGAQVGIAKQHAMIAMAADQGHLWQG